MRRGSADGDPVRVVFSGSTGMVGRAVVPRLIADAGFELVGAIGRGAVGEDAGLAIGLRDRAGVVIASDFREAIPRDGADVLIDFSRPDVAAENCLAAVEAGVAVVLGTTGVDLDAVEDIGRMAADHRVGFFVAPNLSIAAQVMLQCGELARAYFPDVEIVEAHRNTKVDAPSMTAIEAAHRLSCIGAGDPSPDQTLAGRTQARGEAIDGIRIHSIRLPGFYSHHELVFSGSAETLRVTCDQTSARSVVEPILKAARLVLCECGLVRNLPGLFEPATGGRTCSGF